MPQAARLYAELELALIICFKVMLLFAHVFSMLFRLSPRSHIASGAERYTCHWHVGMMPDDPSATRLPPIMSQNSQTEATHIMS
jgi:hypothetical protein